MRKFSLEIQLEFMIYDLFISICREISESEKYLEVSLLREYLIAAYQFGVSKEHARRSHRHVDLARRKFTQVRQVPRRSNVRKSAKWYTKML